MHEEKQNMRSMCSTTLLVSEPDVPQFQRSPTINIIALDAMQARNKTSKENHAMQGCSKQREIKIPTGNHTMRGCGKQGQIGQ